MVSGNRLIELKSAINSYFELMYDCDVSTFYATFSSGANLNGIRDSKLTTWSAEEYSDILKARQSPKSLGSPREEEILLIDFAADTQAMVKVRVRISAAVFIDYLTWHYVDGHWLISAKAYHLLAAAAGTDLSKQETAR